MISDASMSRLMERRGMMSVRTVFGQACAHGWQNVPTRVKKSRKLYWLTKLEAKSSAPTAEQIISTERAILYERWAEHVTGSGKANVIDFAQMGKERVHQLFAEYFNNSPLIHVWEVGSETLSLELKRSAGYKMLTEVDPLPDIKMTPELIQKHLNCFIKE